MAIINIKHKEKDLITLDLKMKQMRFLRDYLKGQHKQIRFMDLSNSDIEAYSELSETDHKLLFESVREDICNFLGIVLTKREMELLK